MKCEGVKRRNRLIGGQRFLLWNLATSLLIPAIAVSVSSGPFRWSDAYRIFVNTLVYSGFISGALYFVMPRLMPRLMRWQSRAKWAVLVVVKSGAAIVGTLAGALVLASAGFISWPDYWAVFRASAQISLLITLTIGSASTAYHVLYFRLQDATLALRTKELEQERALKLATEARLSSLESRVHPHFLFNALNSITSLIREDATRAEQLLIRMSALLRFSLDASQTGVVTVREELKIVEDYLEIERARFGDRLRYTIALEPEVAALEIPPLSVQTLVENSVKYAVGPRRKPTTVRVTASCTDQLCRIAVEDDGPGFALDSLLPGHGLETLQARLALQFPGTGDLHIAREGQWTRVTITIPALRAISAAA